MEYEFVDITAAVGAEDADEQALIPYDDGAGGLAGKARPLYEGYIAPLSAPAKEFAEILFKTHTGAWDDEFKIISEKELQNVQCSYSFADLFKETDKSEKGSTTESVPNLSAACQAWIKCAHSQPKAVKESKDEQTVGDAVDRTLGKLPSAVGDHVVFLISLTVKLETFLNNQMHLLEMETPLYCEQTLKAAWAEKKKGKRRPLVRRRRHC